MKLLLILFLFVTSCTQTPVSGQKSDEFDKIISVMRSKSPEVLYKYFGQPDEVSNDPKNSEIQILRYKDPLINAFLNKQKNKLSHITLFYWKEFDNYTALKQRFKKYKWVENKLPDNPKSDVLTDLFLVKVPEINMEFQYDNNAPKRKVMWVFFD